MNSDPISAALGRSMDRLAAKIGLDQSSETVSDPITRDTIEPKEEITVGATAATVKTAAETAGSQNMTMQERGDYSTHQQELSKQNAETRQSGKEGTETAGNQLGSMESKDKNYTLSSPAAIAQKAVESLAATNPAAAVRFLRFAADDLGGGAEDLGEKVGGEPDEVAKADEEQEAAPPEPAAEPGPAELPGAGGNPMDSVVVTKVQEKIHELAEEIEQDKATESELTDVLRDVGFSGPVAKKMVQSMIDRAKKRREALKRVEALSADTTEMPAAAQGGGKVPHSSTDRDSDYRLGDGDPDESYRSQANKTTSSKTESSTGQEFAASGDRDYKLGQKAKKEADWKEYDKSKKTAATCECEGDCSCEVTTKEGAKKVLGCKDHRNAPNKACRGCLTMARRAAAIEKAKERRAAMLRKKAEERSPDKLGDSAGGDKTTRYESSLKGDTGADEVTPGNEKTLESPATGTVVDDARRTLDTRHNQSTKGSTVASLFTTAQRSEIEKKLAALDETRKLFARCAKAASQVNIPETRGALRQAVQILKGLESVREGIKTAMKIKSPKKARDEFLTRLTQASRLVEQAKREAVYLDALTGTEKRAVARMDRVVPAADLALREVLSGRADEGQFGRSLAHYIKLSPEAFKEAARHINATPTQVQQGRQKTAGTVRRLPAIVTGSPADLRTHVDELEGIFDEDI